MPFLSNTETAAKVAKMFSERKILKQYLAITKYVPKETEGEIDIPLFRRKVNGIEKVLNLIFFSCKFLVFILNYYFFADIFVSKL